MDISHRRQFLKTSLEAAVGLAYNIRFGQLLEASSSDTSELPGIHILRWYGQELIIQDGEYLRFPAPPYSSALIFREDGLELTISCIDHEFYFVMHFKDKKGISKIVFDSWLKGHLGHHSDEINITVKKGDDEELSWWYGDGSYFIKRYRPLRKNESQNPWTQLFAYPAPQEIAVSLGRAPYLTGIYEGKHADLMRRHNQIFRETNIEYRKNLQRIIQELLRQGKIRL